MNNLKSALILSIFFLPKILIAADMVEPKLNTDSLVSPVTTIELFVNEPWLSSIREGKKKLKVALDPLRIILVG